MQTETIAIVRPPTTGDQELASRLTKGLKDASHGVATYSSPEVCVLTTEALSDTTMLIVSPSQCVETSGDHSAFLSRVAGAQKRILGSVGPVDTPRYRGRLSTGISFDAVFDVGFVSQRDQHSDVSEVPYHFVFNGLTREEEPWATESAHTGERTIPWALVETRNHRQLEFLAELFEHRIDPTGFCFLHVPLRSKAAAEPTLSNSGLSAVLSKARYLLWTSDRGVAYYESFRFIQALLAGAVPCKIVPDHPWEGLDIPGVYPSVLSCQTEMQDKGYGAMYRKASDFCATRGRLAQHLSEALRLV